MTKNQEVTIREVYNLVDTKISEVKSSIQRLDDKFMALEAGRLTRVETRVAEMYATHAIETRNTSFWVAFITSVVTGILILIAKYFLKI